mgnify:CR=1 FL=1
MAIYSIEGGLKVFGYDINTEKVSKLNNGQSPIEDISDEILKKSLKSIGEMCKIKYVGKMIMF